MTSVHVTYGSEYIPTLFFLLIHLLFTHLAHAVTQTCIWNSGDIADGYIPCGNSSITSGNCCNHDEVCLSSGLCYGNAELIYRGACINEWGGDCVTICDDSEIHRSSPLNLADRFWYSFRFMGKSYVHSSIIRRLNQEEWLSDMRNRSLSLRLS